MILGRIAGVGRLLCLGGATLGLLGLMGWIVGPRWLTTIAPGQPPMVPNTAMGLMLLGVAGALHRDGRPSTPTRTISRGLAWAVLALGVATVLEYLLGADLHVDDLVHAADLGSAPGRPSPLTALALVLLSMALVLPDEHLGTGRNASERLTLAAGVIAFVSLTGLVFGASVLYRLPSTPIVGVSLPTAASFLLTSVGVLVSRPDVGVVSVVISRGPGGVLLRRLVAPTMLAPVLLGYVIVGLSVLDEPEQVAVPMAVLAATTSVGGVALLIVIARPLNRAHEALEAARNQARDLIDHAGDGIFVADLGGRYTDVNEAGCRLLGRERDEIIGKTILDLIPAEDAPRLAAAKERLLAGETSVSEWMLLHANGTYVPTEVSAKILADGRWQSMVRDISERKRYEEALRTSEREERFLARVGAVLTSSLGYQETSTNIARLVVEELADLCIVQAVEDDGQVRRLSVEHRDPSKAGLVAALQPMLLEPQRVHLGSVAVETQMPQEVDEIDSALLESIAHTEEQLRAWIELDPRSFLALPLVAHGRMVGTMILVSTTVPHPYSRRERRLAEEVARRAAYAVDNARLYREARRAVAVRDDVMGIVVHDLCSPLGVIQIQARMLMNQGAEDAAARIERATGRMQRLVQDLLDVSRLEANRFSVERARVLVDQVVSEAVEAQSALATKASITLKIELAPELPELWADHHRVLQVLENLIGNAIKFTAPGGSITVGAVTRDGEVVLSVADTGTGIEAESLPHLFDRFWQGPRAKRRGAGLGLPIVKGIAEAHGGRVWLESELGRGSTFFVAIPTHASQRASRPA